jgi:hypothetical protein
LMSGRAANVASTCVGSSASSYGTSISTSSAQWRFA